MEAMAVLEKQQQFDFQNNGIEVMNFETLQRTYKENDIYGKPKSRQYTLLCTLYLAFTRIYTRSIHLFLVVQMATLAFPFFHCWRYGMLRYFLRHPLFRYFA